MRGLLPFIILVAFSSTYADDAKVSTEHKQGAKLTAEQRNRFPYNYKGFPFNHKSVDVKDASEAIKSAAKVAWNPVYPPFGYFIIPKLGARPVLVAPPKLTTSPVKLPNRYPYNYAGYPFNYNGFPYDQGKNTEAPEEPKAKEAEPVEADAVEAEAVEPEKDEKGVDYTKVFPYVYQGYPYNYHDKKQAATEETQEEQEAPSTDREHKEENRDVPQYNEADANDDAPEDEEVFVYVMREEEPEEPPTEKDVHPPQKEKDVSVCKKDGYFYHGVNTVLFCTNGFPIIHACAPGTENSGKQGTNADGYEDYSAFCDVNKNTHEEREQRVEEDVGEEPPRKY